jgi:F-type H+-transporting ATPase subunit delta
MYTQTSARYYAHALYPLASGYFTEALQELRGMQELVSADKQFRFFLSHPLFSLEQKKKVITAALRTGLHPEVERLILLLVGRRKIGLLPGVIAYLEVIRQDCTNTVKVEVESAMELGDEEKGRLTALIARQVSRQVIMDFKVQASLIAGFVVHVGGRIIDASVKTKLRRISDQMTQAAVLNQAR